jgi:hypothetical protein
MTHSELESLISAEGREIHRRLLQGHLDLRASDERVQVSVRGADEVERRHHRRRGRGLLTVFGLVTAMRMSFTVRPGSVTVVSRPASVGCPCASGSS